MAFFCVINCLTKYFNNQRDFSFAIYLAFFTNVLFHFFLFILGEALLGLEALIKYPWYDEATGYQLFPFKTMIVIITFITIPLGSLCSDVLFRKGILSKRFDVFQVFDENETETSLSVAADIVRAEKSQSKYAKSNGINNSTITKTSHELQPMIS